MSKEGTRPISPCIKCGAFKLGAQTTVVTIEETMLSTTRVVMCNACVDKVVKDAAKVIIESKLVE